MKKLLAVIGTLALLTGLYALAPIEEDSPAFNCLLHGNNICGAAPNFLGYNY